jgi:hypothetical protein
MSLAGSTTNVIIDSLETTVSGILSDSSTANISRTIVSRCKTRSRLLVSGAIILTLGTTVNFTSLQSGECLTHACAWTGSAFQILGAIIQNNTRSIVQGGFVRVTTGGTVFLLGDLGIFDTTGVSLQVTNQSKVNIQGSARLFGSGGNNTAVSVGAGCIIDYVTNKPIIVGSTPGTNDVQIGSQTYPWAVIPLYETDKSCGVIQT